VGSKSLQNNQRKISKIASIAGISKKRGQLLGRLVRYFDSNNMLEIGTSLGISTASLRLGNPETEITTLEGCQNTGNIAQKSFEKFNFKNINVRTVNFSKTLPEALQNVKYDLIFFDGNHQKEATIDYFEQCLLHIHNDSVFIFDDIYWSKGMQEAWQHIKEHPLVTISIDTFYWGIVFFRKEQKKQHFTIRV
jgi:predicted O-methyltransferase YrrM